MSKRELYRDTENAKLTGVCAGLANYFGLEVWLVRILFLSASLLGGFFLVALVYFALSLMLEKQPPQYMESVRTYREHTLKNKPWEQGQSANELLNTLDRDFRELDTKVRRIEAYVTSEAFRVNREFSKL